MDNEMIEQNLPPQSLEAEQAVLGAVFLNSDALADAMEYVEAKDFFRRAHQLIFQTMVDLNDAGEGIDVLTVQNKLAETSQLEDVGGLKFLMELAQSVPTAANVAYYAKIVEEKSMGRKLISAATDIISMTRDQSDDMPTVLDAAERKVMDVAENSNRSGFRKVANVLDEALNDVYRLSTQKEDIIGLATGYRDFDKMTAGLQNDNLIIIAARPAVGKTAFVLNIAQNVGVSTDKAVAIFSLEMGAESLVNRMLCAEGSIKANNLRTGQLTEEEWDNLTMASGVLSKTNIYIDDTPGIKVAEIRAKCRRLAKETGNLGLIVIDYLQLIEGSNKESRQQEVSEISRQLKKLAKELSVPVIALSQLSRSVEQRQDKRPVLSDIRESGSIEQDADIVAFLYRDDYYRENNDEDDDGPKQAPDDDANDAGEIEVIIEKNRAGARGTVKLLFLKSYNKFVNISYQTQN
ncbi:replicative DNA helicase [Ligilactobacillus sp. WILCCON 0076]|uniref:Replicative DNA helicase n=1 Tax=Ligilactobacillus ubinensis TaxID=2876789 RepID=A0A9X2JMJ5_9LACO|nr:replicative DNA helicase [Ligilactobacillus ubinensis]MCP0887146.1 replicative DNA helicase [Ligilactobacillus ubinensis]